MKLTWKDAAATTLTAGAVGLYGAFLAGTELPLVSAPRALAGVVLVLGLGACALGGSDLQTNGRPSRWMIWLGTLGGVALLTGVITLITGSEVVLATLVGITVVLWLLATARHIFAGRGGISDRELQQLIDDEKKKDHLS